MTPRIIAGAVAVTSVIVGFTIGWWLGGIRA